MIHSFSAANLSDPETIAARWLANGAYAFFGAVNEPFVHAFRPPGLVTELIAADVPLVAALRQNEREPFGFPWRLIYLGDPLYRVGRGSRESSTLAQSAEKNGPKSGQQRSSDWNWWGSRAKSPSTPESQTEARINAAEWAKAAAPHELEGIVPIVTIGTNSNQIVAKAQSENDSEKLQLCVELAIAEAASPSANLDQGSPGKSGETTRPARPTNDWRTVLLQVRRERLEEKLRSVYDELLIDALEEVGALEELQARLIRIPPEEAGPRVWQAHELCAFDRLSRLPHDRSSESFDEALRIWDAVISLSWPKGSRFPVQLTERVAAMTGVDPGRRLALWQEQLRRTAERLQAHQERFPHVGAILSERTRVEAQRAHR